MSLGVTKKGLKKRFAECQANQAEDQGHPVTKCSECDLYTDCCTHGEETFSGAMEAARQPDGRFGKLYLDETSDNDNETKKAEP